MSLQGLLFNIPFTIIATGALVGIAASLLGSFLVLKRSSMLTDAISHSIVFGIVITWLLTRQQSGPVQLLGAALTGLLTVVLVEALVRTGRVKSDASIGLVFPALFSVGVLLLNVYARDVHIDTHTVLLGEIGFVWLNTVLFAGLEVPRALLTMSVVGLVDLAFVLLLYKELKLMAFDEMLARSMGFMPGLLYYALLALTSTTAVAAFDAVGAVLFIAFAIVPPAAAYLLTDRLWRMILYGSAIALAASLGGYALAVAWNVSIGGMMALLTGVALLLALLLGPRYGLIAGAVRAVRQGQALDRQALVVHLFRHEGTASEAEESRPETLREHLSWSPERARKAIGAARENGLLEVDDQRLRLTDKGRALGRQIIEPWRHGASEAV